jgi:hypothetical protein
MDLDDTWLLVAARLRTPGSKVRIRHSILRLHRRRRVTIL